MKKTNLIVILVIVLLVAVSSFLFIRKNVFLNTNDIVSEDSSIDESGSTDYSEESVADENTESTNTLTSAEADETLAKFGKIGEAYTFTSHQYLQGEVRERNVVSLGWNGSMELCVNKAEVLDYSEDLLGDSDNKEVIVSIASSLDSPKIFKINFSLTNIDAANKDGVQYQFNLSLFKLGSYNDLIPENYNDYENYVFSCGTCSDFISDPHGQDDEYYIFALEPGETKDFTLTYVVEEEYLKQKDIFFGISGNRVFNYGIKLDELSEK